jgi:hypothetical protein
MMNSWLKRCPDSDSKRRTLSCRSVSTCAAVQSGGAEWARAGAGCTRRHKPSLCFRWGEAPLGARAQWASPRSSHSSPNKTTQGPPNL